MEDYSYLINQFDESASKKHNLHTHDHSRLKRIQHKVNFTDGVNPIICSQEDVKKVYQELKKFAHEKKNLMIVGEYGSGKKFLSKHYCKLLNKTGLDVVTINIQTMSTDFIKKKLLKLGSNGQSVIVFDQCHTNIKFSQYIWKDYLHQQRHIVIYLSEKEFDLAKNKFSTLQTIPLRERPEDLILFVDYFINKNFSQGKSLDFYIAENVLGHLLKYSWPNNIFELENMIRRVVTTHQTHTLLDHHIPEHIKSSDVIDVEEKIVSGIQLPSEGLNLKKLLSKLELSLIEQAMKLEKGNKLKAANRLSINRTTLIEKLKRYKVGESK